MGVGQLPDHEHGKGHDSDHRKGDDFIGGKPVQLLALVQHQLQCRHPEHKQGQAYGVDRQLARGRFAVAVDAPGHEGREQAHGHVDVEDPGPGNIVRDPAAQQRPDHGSDQRGHAP